MLGLLVGRANALGEVHRRLRREDRLPRDGCDRGHPGPADALLEIEPAKGLTEQQPLVESEPIDDHQGETLGATTPLVGQEVRDLIEGDGSGNGWEVRQRAVALEHPVSEALLQGQLQASELGVGLWAEGATELRLQHQGLCPAKGEQFPVLMAGGRSR